LAIRTLIQVNPATIAELHNPAEGTDFLYLDKNRAWFRQDYVDAGFPRSEAITTALRDGAVGYAVWADDQGVIKTFPDYLSAERARSGATMKLAVEYDVSDEEPEEEPEVKPVRKVVHRRKKPRGSAAAR